MKLFKATAMALVAGAGLALVASQALAQDSTSTATTSINGNEDVFSLHTGISSTQIDATHTEGGAIAAAIATPIFTASGGASLPGGSLSATGPQTQGPNEGGSPFGGQFGTGPQLGHVLDGGSLDATLDNGETDTFALNHVALWLNVEAADRQGSATTSNTSSTGVSVAGLFVFGQTIAVGPGSELNDNTQFAPEVSIDSNVLDTNSGNIALNQVAGVGNQQGNNLSTLLEVSGNNGTTAGANSVNVEGNQTLANAGLITDSALFGGESASIAANSLDTNAGNVAVNQGAGVANQQVNNVTLAH